VSITHVVVAIPVRDEAVLLGECLTGVTASIDGLRADPTTAGVAVDVVVALDGCTDASGCIARSFGVRVVELDSVGVGAARHAAITAGLAGLAGVDLRDVWIANTDADTFVSPEWLARHLRWAESGRDVVVGTVEPVGVPDPVLLAEWHARHELVEDHTYVHGANLGIRASTYLDLGGFPAARLHEDVELVARARHAGVAVVATDTTRVRTSGRLTGRVPDGFAGYLRSLPA